MTLFSILGVLIAVAGADVSKPTPIEGSQILSTTYKIEPGSASEFLIQNTIALEKLVAGIDKAKGEDAKKKEAAIKSLVSGILDLDVLGRRALITYWDEVNKTANGKKLLSQYMATFKKLVEENYLEKARQYVNGKYQIPLTGEEKTAKGSKITAKIKKTDVDLLVEFYVVKGDKGWRVVDIKLDDTSLEETYRGSFNRIIKKKGGIEAGLPELIAVMDKRLQELKKGKATSI
ncbi:MAG: ABC transporter substrate-binding protein [Deltaproteobacteria bacterium]|nr:ABC transporter substrate-binding protein [Deltaproteobacteria bacterium]